MTTPNNPTPPPGMEILTDYTKPLPEGAHAFLRTEWCISFQIGRLPSKRLFYAVPITHPARVIAIAAISEYLKASGWVMIWDEAQFDVGQWICPTTQRSHDIDYAFSLQLHRELYDK